jgi:hypothetical protein
MADSGPGSRRVSGQRRPALGPIVRRADGLVVMMNGMRPDLLPALTSATAYPSIETYHALGDKGRLTEERNVVFEDDVVVTEMIDGANARIIFEPLDADIGEIRGWLIGSREKLLTAADDLVYNPSEGIVECVRDVANSVRALAESELITVIFGEVYGGKQNASKHYTSSGAWGYRVFDIAVIPADKLFESRERLASWRDHGGQEFLTTKMLKRTAAMWDLHLVPEVVAPAPPADVRGTSDWLAEYAPKSLATLDEAATARPEGLVVRSPDRSKIAKIRFEDYARTPRTR